jgi:hypothetical protein
VAVGPEGLGEVTVEQALALPGAHRVGADARPTVWYELADGWDGLARVAARLHADLPDPRL